MKKLFLLLLAIFFSVTSKSQVTLETVYETPYSQINLYIVSQGYDSGSMADFDTFVGDQNNGFLNRLWNTAPFSTYQQNFRVIVVRDVATTDTYPRAFNQFNPPYNCTANATDGAEDYATFKSRMDSLISTSIPGFDDKSYLLAVFNNDFYSAGGGQYTFTTDYCNNPYMYNILIHEFGHTFGLLGDEYGATTATVGPDDFPLFHNRNVTEETSLANIPWNYLINSGTPIPTCTNTSGCPGSLNGTVGLFQTANYSTDWYRSERLCKMLYVDQPFCQNCQNLLEEMILKHLCFSSNTVSEDFVSRHQYITHWRKAMTSLSSSSEIGNKITVNYVSGNAIQLTDGFLSEAGSDFFGYIGDCNAIDVRNPYRSTTNNIKIPITVAPPQKITGLVNTADGIIKISPNPSSDKTVISSSNALIKNIALFSMDGKLIFTLKAIGKKVVPVNLTNYQKGIYTVSIETETGEIITKKLVKE